MYNLYNFVPLSPQISFVLNDFMREGNPECDFCPFIQIFYIPIFIRNRGYNRIWQLTTPWFWYFCNDNLILEDINWYVPMYFLYFYRKFEIPKYVSGVPHLVQILFVLTQPQPYNSFEAWLPQATEMMAKNCK